MKPLSNNRFRFFTGKFIDKQLISGIDYFNNGEFKANQWKKTVSETNFYNVDYPKETFVFKQIENEIDYIKLGNFNSSTKGITESNNFYDLVKDKLTAKNLIVDLRNNSGGGDKSSKQFYKLLKKHKGKIFVLINFQTVSNAEQFALNLKKTLHASLLGDNSKGRITYGRNYGNSKETPSQNFRFIFSDLKDHWTKYFPFEGIGINPDVKLDETRNWIEQTVEIIKIRTTNSNIKMPKTDIE